MARCVHRGRASGAELRHGPDAGRRRTSRAVRCGIGQRDDHRHPEGREAQRRGVGTRQVPHDGRPRAGDVLERDPQRALHAHLREVARPEAGSALRDVPEDLQQSELGDGADHRRRQREPVARRTVHCQVAGWKGERPARGPEEARQAGRRAERAGEEGRRRAVIPAAIADATAASPAIDRRRARRKAAWRRRGLVLLLMSPWLAGFSLFFGYPIVMSAYLSFNHYDLLSSPRWVGWANYHYLLHDDPLVWPAVRNTIWLIAVAVPLQVVFAFGVALMLARAKSGVGFFRTIFYLPALVPPVAATLGFVYLLNPATGPVNTLLGKLGIEGPLWFQSPDWSKPSLVLLGMWGVGNTMIIFLAAILDVPQHLYESAQLDGASALQRLRWVTLPTISPVILFSVVIGVIYGLQYFTQAYVAGNVAAGQASQAGDTVNNLGYPQESTLFYPVLLYQEGFTYFHMGYASALTMLLLGVAFTATLVIVVNSRRWVHYQAPAR